MSDEPHTNAGAVEGAIGEFAVGEGETLRVPSPPPQSDFKEEPNSNG
jgi:hypothetical protein